MRALMGTLLMLLMGVTLHAQPSTAPATQAGTKAVVVVFDGEVDDFHKTSLENRFKEARKLGADTIILQIDTYGGLVTSGLDISRFLKQQDDLHVVAFVHEKAISAGAMISLACREIVMQPGSLIGDCAPIVLNSSGDGLQSVGATERAKMESPILEDFYDSATRNGYNPILVQAMVSVGRVVHWVQNSDGERRFVDEDEFKKLSESGWKPVEGVRDPLDSGETLLTLGAELAQKIGLATSIHRTPQELAAERGWTILETLSPSSSELLVGFLSSSGVRAILTTVFLFSLYMSFSHPGHGAPEAVALSTLALLAGVPLLTGYAQWWEILIILLGIILLAIEIFMIPGFGVTGISGILMILLGLTLTWVGDEPIGIPGILPKLPGTWAAFQHGLVIVVGGMISSLALWFWLQRYLPRLPYFNRLILTTTSGDVVTPTQAPVAIAAWPVVGTRGRVVTDLRPGGTAAFRDDAIDDDRITDVVSDSGFVASGKKVLVREVRGSHVVVRAVGET